MRKLADFQPLKPAEQKLLEAAGTGEWCRISPERPRENDKGPDNIIRAGFIRFLALGGDEHAFVHEHGILLIGAWIEGALDLIGCKISKSLGLIDCWFEETLGLLDASTKTIALSGSRMPGLDANRLRSSGSVFLRHGFEARDKVRLHGARISGHLVCDGGTFRNESDLALDAGGMDVAGSVLMRDGFEALGEVCLIAARIGADLDCSRGKFRNKKGDALCGQNLEVEGTFLLRDVETIEGSIDLSSARVEDLVDDAVSWAKADSLIIDGFNYDRVSGNAPTDYANRKAWLLRQTPSHLTENFRPQPFEQLAKVLREMGHVEDARRISILKQDYQRRANWLQARQRLDVANEKRSGETSVRQQFKGESAAARDLSGAAFRRLLGWGFKWTSGYGYRPIRALGWMAGLCVVGFFAFALAYSSGVIVPAETRILVSKEWIGCADAEATAQTDDGRPVSATKCWLHTAQGLDYPRFNAFWYSLDTFVPILDLHQETAWMPQPERAEEGSWAGWARASSWDRKTSGVPGSPSRLRADEKVRVSRAEAWQFTQYWPKPM